MGHKEGGIKARDKNYAIQGIDWYERIGKIGGRNSSGYKFGHGAVDPSVIGKIGGTISRRGSEKDDRPEAIKTCNFCFEQGHSAYTCSLRANINKRKQIALARKRVEQEERQDNMNKLSRIASKYGVRRPW